MVKAGSCVRMRKLVEDTEENSDGDGRAVDPLLAPEGVKYAAYQS
jgi:hypothetical protein